MTLGPYAGFIVASYAIAACVVAVMIGWLWIDGRRQARALAALKRAASDAARPDRKNAMDTDTQMTSPAGGAAPQDRKRSWLAFLPAIVFVAVAVLFLISLLWPVDPQKLPSMLIGKPAPQITLPPLEGVTDNGAPVRGVTPADFAQGKPVIVNFWQSSCAPCVAEHPLLIILAEKTGAPLIGINYQDPAAGARRFLNRYGNPFSAIGVDASGRAAIEWGVYGMPETFIVDGKGTVLYKHIGEITPDVVDKILIPLIAKAR